MSEPKIAGRTPIKVDLEEGTKAWCSCGHSKNQPWCDGSHSGTGMTPVMMKIDQAKTAHICTCKQTKNPGYCDGAHKTLPPE